MRLLLAALLAGCAPLAHAQDPVNPSLAIETVEIPAAEFNAVLREAPVRELGTVHAVSWQVTIDNGLAYAHPGASAVLRVYGDGPGGRLIEVGMGAQPDHRFWVAVQTPKEGYVVVHRDAERGWYPQAKTIVSYTDRAGLTVNNGARIVVTNLDIGTFAAGSWSAHGLEHSGDRPAANSGALTAEFLSGDPAENAFSMYPFYMAAAIGAIVGLLFATKRR